MNSFTTKYIVAIVILAILMIVFREPDLVEPFSNALGILGLLAAAEAISEFLKE